MAKYSNSNNGLYLNVYIEQGAQNIAANTTTVNWRATVSRPVYYHTYNLQGDSTLSLSLDGRNVHSSNPRWEVWDGEAELASGSSVINHNADGTKTFALSCTFNPNNGLHKTMTVRANISLSSIPRLSNLSIGQGVIGSNLAITINRQNNNFTHTLRYSWAGKSGTIATNVATSHSWTIPVDFANNIPNSNSGTGTLYLDTYSGDTKIGTQSKQFTASIPSGLKPSFTGITLTDTHAAAGALLSGNDFLQIISDIKVTFNGANGTYGSKITGYRAEIVGKNHIVTENGGRLGMMNFKGSASIRAYVIDSRGQRSDTKTVNINVLEYFAPSFSFSALRTREHPNVLQVIRNARIAPITQGGRQRNTMALSFKVAQLGSSNYTADNGSATGIYTTVHTLTNSAANLSGNYPATKSFTVIGRLEDKFTSVEFSATVATESVVMSYDKDGRVGVGKVAELGQPGSLDVLGDIFARNKPIQQYQLTDNNGCGKLIKQDFNTMKETGTWWIDGSSQNNPFSGAWGMLEVFKPSPGSHERIQRFTTSSGYMAVRENGFDNNWRPWRYVAQQSMSTNNSDYSALQKNVTKKIDGGWGVKLNATRNGNTVTLSTEHISVSINTDSDYRELRETLPAGFRPASEAHLILQGHSGSTISGTAILHLATDGKIRLTSRSPGNKFWVGTITYITSDPYP